MLTEKMEYLRYCYKKYESMKKKKINEKRYIKWKEIQG